MPFPRRISVIDETSHLDVPVQENKTAGYVIRPVTGGGFGGHFEPPPLHRTKRSRFWRAFYATGAE